MPAWTFRTYLSSSGRDEVAEWYRSLPEPDQARVFRLLQQLRDTPQSGWHPPIYKTLTQFAGMGRVRSGRYRLIGFFGPAPADFTFVYAYMKKGSNIPKHVRRTCTLRRAEVEADEGRSHEWIVDP